MKSLWMLALVGLTTSAYAGPPSFAAAAPPPPPHVSTLHVNSTAPAPAPPHSSSTGSSTTGPTFGTSGYYYGYGGGGSAGNAGESSYQDIDTPASDTPPGYAPPFGSTPTTAAESVEVDTFSPINRHQRQLVGRVVSITPDEVTLKTALGPVTLTGTPTPGSILPGDLVVAWATDDNRWTDLARVKL